MKIDWSALLCKLTESTDVLYDLAATMVFSMDDFLTMLGLYCQRNHRQVNGRTMIARLVTTSAKNCLSRIDWNCSGLSLFRDFSILE